MLWNCHTLLQESICAAWPKWAPWRAPLLPATVNRWPATEAPAAGKGFTAAGHLTCPSQKIVIYRGGRYESPAAVNTIYRGGLFKLPAVVKS